ncbi:MAG: HD domain-containing protein [Rikenellaceae bacterium]
MNSFEEQIEREITEICNHMAPRVTPEDLVRLRAAYELANEAHALQKRKSGEPYIIHPIAVARIVAEELNLDANSVIAAFLHDVVEDTSYTIGDIQSRFGEDVAFLVNIITKQKKERYEMSKQLDNYKQMLDSVQFDLRALLIKLADRLHNMRTLESMRPDKQMKIAGETDYFYAPLANRLGLYDVKTELENLSFKYRCPQEYAIMESNLTLDEENNREWLTIFTAKINELLEAEGFKARIKVIYRMPYSIWRKMRKTGRDFHHVDHRHITRVIFESDSYFSDKDTCLRIYSILTDKLKEKPGSFINYVDAPKENGYQSLHVRLLSDRGAWEEIHILSQRMLHNSQMGCQADISHNNVQKWIAKFKAVLQDIAYHQNSENYMESVVTAFYNDDIMVFTPQGLGIILPFGATALDFAFEIHSKVGLHARYARINGRLCSVKSQLSRGDCVEIATSGESSPSEDWLDHVKTYKAKRNLYTYFKKQRHIPHHRCQYCQPLPGGEVIGFKEDDGSISVHKRDCRVAIELASQKGDSIVAVEFFEDRDFLFPVKISIRAVDRYHLLSDLIDCITNKLQLGIDMLHTETVDAIVTCSINFSVHSIGELQRAIAYINTIDCVDEVRREEI